MRILTIIIALFTLPLAVYAAFGYTDNGSEYVIDSGASLVIKVSKSNGDITSIVYKGVEYQGYQGKNTHVESGLGASTVTIQQFSSPAYIIKVAVTYGTLKHYLFVRYGNNNVYIFTNKGDSSVAASRYIVRLKPNVFPHSSTDSGKSTLSPIQGATSNEKTQLDTPRASTTKEAITDVDYVGKTTGSVGVWLIRSNHEKASGGPFFRSLVRGCTTIAEDLYDIYFYSMGHTDPERYGLQGPTLDGWTAWGNRGWVSGVGVANMKSGYTYVIGLANTAAQYWGTAASSGGAWSIKNVLPGTYTLTLYKGELAVGTRSVTVNTGAGTAINTMTPTDPSDTTAIWRIGDWDGTPAGFLNFDKSPMLPTYMHPSDVRISTWDPGNFIVGTSATNSFPGYMWKDVNNGHVVYFRLSAAQYASTHTIRIGITEAFIGGRPQISVNSWTSAAPSPSTQGSTRSLTVGTYRGNNVVFSYDVPASAWLQRMSSDTDQFE
ncbi:hypothetical protein N8T08_003298 [Aspergillus melleus]|uniref:Uncharacterized protein n=1 Tax=Aspergillus melleus TaxID=138277 RepID=A0ACC3B815_9EURO|nr:hypothetical protein N8T08_003298 [Aspergillus melleus]